MFSLLISLIVGAVVVVSCSAAQLKTPSVFFGVIGFFVSYYLVGFLVRRRVKKVQNELQSIMMDGQQRVSRKIQLAQNKPGVNFKALQRQLELDQKAIYTEAVNFTERLEPFQKWSLLMGKQISSMRFQFLYQLKDFEKVDAILSEKNLLKSPLLIEPMMVAMKMARQYKHGDMEGAEKTFKSKIKWFRNDRGILLYGLMSWIYVKNGEAEKARELLLKAKEKTGNETFTFNWERLSNNKEKSFSNAGLGDEWYSLYLETPPQPKQPRVRASGRGGRRPF